MPNGYHGHAGRYAPRGHGPHRSARSDWRKYDVVLDVPSEAQNIAFGVLLAGEGQVWTDDVSLTSE